MRLSVVVTTYDRRDDLVECVESLRRQFDPPAEIVVVDDGDVEATARRLDDAGLDDVTHVNGGGGGIPEARNRGTRVATGDVIAFVDDDVVVPPNWATALKRTYERFPEAVGVGGYVLNYNPEGINKANLASSGYRLLQGVRQAFLLERVGDVSPVGILWAPHVFMTEGPRTVDALQGCNMSFRAEVFESHAFDEWYGRSGSSALEEVDFSVRVSTEDGDLIYDPRAVAVHKRTLAAEADERAGGPNYGNTTNLTYFVLNHPGMGVANVVLLVAAVTVYAALTRDVERVVALKRGLLEYWKHGRGADVGRR